MIKTASRRRLIAWLILTGVSLVVYFVRLLPLDLSAGRWPGPDWVVVLGFSWVLRRPEYVPVGLFAALIFLGDMLFMRPPGLWAAITVMGLEFLRRRAQFSRELPFLIEWGMFAGVYGSMVLTNRLIQGVFLVDQPGIGLDALLWLGSVAIYPLVVLASAYVFGVRKAAPGAVDDLGHPI
jgi:rod shape-determining protein MreD